MDAQREGPEVGHPGGREAALPFAGEPDAPVLEEAGHIPEDQHEVGAGGRREPVEDFVREGKEQDGDR